MFRFVDSLLLHVSELCGPLFGPMLVSVALGWSLRQRVPTLRLGCRIRTFVMVFLILEVRLGPQWSVSDLLGVRSAFGPPSVEPNRTKPATTALFDRQDALPEPKMTRLALT